MRKILQVFRTLHRLKELPRQGFVYFGFKGDETDSIAEHSFMVTWIAHIIGRQYFTADQMARATLMALVHDWGEAVTGDFSYKVKEKDNSLDRIEESAFLKLVEGLPNKPDKEFLTGLWQEYKESKSPEAHVVKFADVLDAWLQGLVTTTTWWPAWEDRKRSALSKMATTDPELKEKLSRICDLARDPNVQIWLPNSEHDDKLWTALRFFKEIYCLKELPRQGFTLFGMKRNETDSFAGHGFTTACLALLIALKYYGTAEAATLMDVVMVSLSHDLSVARTGDAAYDFQECNRIEWNHKSDREFVSLVQGLEQGQDIAKFHKTWLDLKEDAAWITKMAAAVDAWEMGVTTPSSWMYAWIDYRKKTLEAFEGAGNPVAYQLVPLLKQAYTDLSVFKSNTLDDVVGRSPEIQPIRLRSEDLLS